MLEFEYDLKRSDEREYNPEFGKIRIVDSGSNVILITGKNGSGKTLALEMLRFALGEPMTEVPARLKLTSLDGKTSLESSIEPGIHSILNGKHVDYTPPNQFKIMEIDLREVLFDHDGIDALFSDKFESIKERFDRFLRKVDTIDSSNGVLLMDDTALIENDDLDRLVKRLRALVKKKRLMAAVIAKTVG